jgi:organic radical activating enzyme
MKLKVSEIFYSLQGEGRYVGVPSVFLRTFGCNFTCSGFGMPLGDKSQERNLIDASKFTTFSELPLVPTGCDSYASWDPRFKDLSPTKDTETIVDELLSLTPNGKWMQYSGNPVHLVITGGEPLLGWQRLYPELLNNPRMEDLDNITFETNGTQLLDEDFVTFIEEWHMAIRGQGTPEYNDYLGRFREIQFSVSPKLTTSGEKWKEAILPAVIAQYQNIGVTYLKFVVSCKEDLLEAQQAVNEYRNAGFMGQVYVMPSGGTSEMYNTTRVNIADEALRMGFNYSPRLHVDLWGNGWGK